MNLTPSRELVLKKLRDCFPDPAIAQEALASLDRYGVKDWHIEKDRVHLAVLKQSQGQLWRLRDLLTQLKKQRLDYRDVLAGAEYPQQRNLPPKTPPGKMAAIHHQDREQYVAWLLSDQP